MEAGSEGEGGVGGGKVVGRVVGGGKVVGRVVVVGREAVKVGRREVGVEGEVAGQGEATPPGQLAAEWVGWCSLTGLAATSEAAVAACLG